MSIIENQIQSDMYIIIDQLPNWYFILVYFFNLWNVYLPENLSAGLLGKNMHYVLLTIILSIFFIKKMLLSEFIIFQKNKKQRIFSLLIYKFLRKFFYTPKSEEF